MATKTTKGKSIKTMRLSGRPVNIKHLLEFDKMWKDFFDKVQEKYGQDMQAVHVRLERYEKLLQAKFKNIEDWQEIKTIKQWSKKLDEYGPILLAKEKDTGEVLYIIADQNFQ